MAKQLVYALYRTYGRRKDGRTRYGLKYVEQHPIKYVEQHPIKYVEQRLTEYFRIFFTTSVMRFGRTDLKRCASKAKKSSEQRGAVHLSAAPPNPG